MAWLLQTVALQRGNTLHASGRWESSKVGIDYGILGSVSFLVTRTALHRNRLDPGTWHGYHEVLHRSAVDLRRMALRFRLERPGYLVAILRHDGERFEGVRLSRDPAFPSACLAGDATGRFTGRRALDPGPLDGGWHRLEAERADGGFAVRVDGAPAGTCPASLAGAARFGVRGSADRKTYVDDLVVEARDGSIVTEDFARHEGAPLWLAASLGLLGAVYGLVLATTRGRVRPHVALVATHLSVLPCVVLLWGVDTFYLGRVHPEAIDFDRYPYENHIEYESAVRRRLEALPQGPPPPGVRRVLLLGTSQTWGSGARTPDETWAARLEDGLQVHAAEGERFEVVDAGVPGLQAPQLVPLYEELGLPLAPELVIVNLANNDRDPDTFRRALERIAALGAERGIRTVFVPEANTIEGRSPGDLRGLEERQEVLREVAAAWRIPVVETHEPLIERADEGFLWWDRVHLTSFGQQLLAGVLLASSRTLLEAPPPTPPADAGPPSG